MNIGVDATLEGTKMDVGDGPMDHVTLTSPHRQWLCDSKRFTSCHEQSSNTLIDPRGNSARLLQRPDTSISIVCAVGACLQGNTESPYRHRQPDPLKPPVHVISSMLRAKPRPSGSLRQVSLVWLSTTARYCQAGMDRPWMTSMLESPAN